MSSCCLYLKCQFDQMPNETNISSRLSPRPVHTPTDVNVLVNVLGTDYQSAIQSICI